MKKCAMCEKVKTPDQFGKNRTTRDGLSYYCCKVNLKCKRRKAVYWYVIENGKPAFYTINIPKPKHQPVPCCDLCADAIMAKVATD